MEDSSNSPMKTNTEQQTPTQPPGPNNPTASDSDQQDSSAAPTSVTPATTTTPVNPIPNPIPSLQPTAQQPTVMAPPQIQPFVPPPQVSSVPPSFRPAAPPVPLPTAPQFSPLPNPNFQNPGGQVQVQPPGVMMPPPSSGGMSSVPQMMPQQYPQQYPQLSQQPMRMYAPMPNGYQMPAPQGQMPPPGILRYPPPPYASMLRPAYPQRPPGAVGIIPALPRPPVLGMRNPVIPTIVRPPIIPTVTPTEKPQTTVYVGKIASTVENDFMLSLLQLCGPVKSWKRAQDPTSGALKGFGFCEFESAEGVLRALRLLSKLSIDGQELMLNVNQATREYLERYVEKKKENMKNLKLSETEGAQKEIQSESGLEKGEPPKPLVEDSKEVSKEDPKEDNKEEASKENNDNANFGLVTDEDKEADREATEKLTGMIEERIKTKPLPPPPPPPQTSTDVSGNSNVEFPARSRDGDSDVDIVRNDAVEDRNDDEMTSNSKPSSEQERPETSSPDRSNKNDRRSRDRDRDLKREKERELERYEREREQERAKREREREYKIREDERRYRARLKEWESREKEKERARKQEREREKDREQDRLYEIMDQESEDGYSKKRKYKSSGEEREERKRRMREKEEDMADRVKEEEEIAEAKRRAEEERERQKEQQKHALELLSGSATNGTENVVLLDKGILESRNKAVGQTADGDLIHGNENGNGVIQNGSGDESAIGSLSTAETRQNNSVPTKKLGFGLVGSGKRTTVPSVFHEEEDEDAQKEKKMRPLVPIDYSTEELQAVRESTPVAPSPNLAAAAEFAKRIGNANSKEERSDSERERGRRLHDRSNQRDRDRNVEETYRPRDESRKESAEWDKERDRGLEKVKTPDNKKLLDAKQLIDTIPKTKDELFSYEINWAIYDKNGLHERMRPWISKKITDFLGEEETTLVDYIVSSTQEHVKADEMLDRLQSILDDEAEMFVLKMWRMLIFEIKKVETGLASRKT